MSLKPNKLHQFQKPLDWSFCLSDKVFILLHFLVAVGRAKCGKRGTFYNLFIKPQSFRLLLCGSSGKESTCNVGDLGSIPGLGRIPWRKERLPTTAFWPGEFHGLYSPWGCKESDTTEQLSLSVF